MNEPVTGDELLSLIQITSSLLHAFVFPSIPVLQSCSLGLKDFQGVAPELPPPSFPCAVSVHFFFLLLQCQPGSDYPQCACRASLLSAGAASGPWRGLEQQSASLEVK